MTTTSPAKELVTISSNYIGGDREGYYGNYVALYKDSEGNIYDEVDGNVDLVTNKWGSHVDSEGYLSDEWLTDLEEAYNSREAAVLFAGFTTNGDGKFRSMLDGYIWASHCLFYDLF